MKQSFSLWKISASLLSFVLTYWIIFLNPVINNDGILYLQTADKFLQGDWGGAFELYPWPFYSLVIAAVNKITFLDLESSAHLITAFSAAMLSYVFISLLQELDRERVIPFFIALFVIVFFSELNETRNMIIRGHGYWAFYLLALLCLVRFYRVPLPVHGLAWNFSIIIATLFRIEGMVFLLLLPVVLLFRRGWGLTAKLKYFLTAHLLSLSACLGGLMLSFSGALPGWLAESRLSDPLFFINKFRNALADGLAANSSIIEEAILNKYSEDAAIWVALLIPAVIIAIALINALTPLYAAILCWKPGRSLSRLRIQGAAVLYWAVLLNLLIFVVVAFARYFLFERFAMPLAFILLLILGFTLSQLYESWRKNGGRMQPWRRKWIYYLVILLLIINSGEALVHAPGDSKRYLKTAGAWLQQNVPGEARIFTNNIKLRFYSGYLDNQNLPEHELITADKLNSWKKKDYDYLAFWVDHRSPLSLDEINGLIGCEPLKKFANRNGDFVLIFRK